MIGWYVCHTWPSFRANDVYCMLACVLRLLKNALNIHFRTSSGFRKPIRYQLYCIGLSSASLLFAVTINTHITTAEVSRLAWHRITTSHPSSILHRSITFIIIISTVLDPISSSYKIHPSRYRHSLANSKTKTA